MENYDDIINLKRPVSKHPKMSLYQRSAQFAPFAALTGYEGQVKETARLTDKKIELDEEVKVMLDMKIQVIQEMLSNNPELEITYFISVQGHGSRLEGDLPCPIPAEELHNL